MHFYEIAGNYDRPGGPHPAGGAGGGRGPKAQYNIGALPVCGYDGSLKGLVTDRDIVTRCLAAGRDPAKTQVSQVMTARVVTARPDMEVSLASHLMGREQVRRLPIVENGRLCGMVSLGDLAGREETVIDASDALSDISGNLSSR